jgi:hypothetical protein
MIVSICACTGSAPPSAKRPSSTGDNAIVRENRQPGQAGWYRNPSATGIAGYATASSVEAGGSLDVAVSTTSPTYSIDVFRIGWYGGAQARLLLSVNGLHGADHGQWRPGTFGVQNCPTCTYDPGTGLLQLAWPISYTLHVHADWVSGNFVLRLTTPESLTSYIPFIVRDSRPSAVVAVMPVNTYEAYNMWGGKSLYSDSLGPKTLGVGDNAPSALKVSFQRPFGNYQSEVKIDYETVGFLEKEGYDVGYATSIDLDRDRRMLSAHRMFLSVGHDEYWSWNMRDAVESARDRGINAMFLSGNDIYWQARYEPGVNDQDHEVLVCYRDASIDPLSAAEPSRTTVRWVDPPVRRAQDGLTGTIYTGNSLARPTNWIVATTAPDWLLKGTGLKPGSSVSGLVGLECDGVVTRTSRPFGWQSSHPPSPMVLVSQSPVVTALGTHLVCNTVYYRVAGGGQVFSAGTRAWQDFLNGPNTNGAVIRMTENAFRGLIA